MMNFSLEEILTVTAGHLTAPVEEKIRFSSIMTDSRHIAAGSLFIALKGEKFDGADYARKAVEKGAAGVIVSLDCPEEKIVGLPCVIKAADTLTAYQAIARGHRRRFSLPLIAVTGSNGKTTTKDLTAAVLGAALNTLKTATNFNNEIGLPLTLLKLTPEHEAAVVEMGMRGLGQIAALAAVAEPTIGIITNVGETHMELLGSIENIARAKGELVEALPIGGTAILNADNEFVRRMAEKAKDGVKIITYGSENPADVRAENIVADGFTTKFRLKFAAENESYQITLPLAGKHNVSNALAALAAAYALGLVPQYMEKITAALADFQASGQRFECIRRGDWQIINDAYNASPMSMTAALDTLKEITGENKSRRIAVLGDMLELGHIARAEHEAVGRRVFATGVDYLITRGEMGHFIAQGALASGMNEANIYEAPSHEAAAEKLRTIHQLNDTVLFKGSHGMKMDAIIDLL